MGVVRQRDHFGARGTVWERKTGTGLNSGVRVGGCAVIRGQHRTQEANLPYSAGFPQASLVLRRGLKRMRLPHHGPATWLLSPRERVPGTHSTSGASGEIWSLGSPWYVCRFHLLCFRKLETHFSLNGQVPPTLFKNKSGQEQQAGLPNTSVFHPGPKIQGDDCQRLFRLPKRDVHLRPCKDVVQNSPRQEPGAF